MFSSESVALDCLGYEVEKDLDHGETIYIDQERNVHMHSYDSNRKYQKAAFDSIGLEPKDFDLKDNNINAIVNSDYTIIINDINNNMYNK